MNKKERTDVYCGSRVQITTHGIGQPTEDVASSYYLATDYFPVPQSIKQYSADATVVQVLSWDPYQDKEVTTSRTSLFFYDAQYNYLGSVSGVVEVTTDASASPFMANAAWVRASVYNSSSHALYPGRQACKDSIYGSYYLGGPFVTVEYTYQQWESDEEGFYLEDVAEAPEKPMKYPFPASEWRVEGGKVTNALLPDYVPSGEGAFKYASHLTDISIPRSVKFIGEEAFRYTALTRVRIAEDCVFFPTSFPEGCAVELNDTVEYGQLVDCDGVEILDCEAVRLYVKGEVE